MRAAIFRNGEIVVDTLAEPKPGAGQVLVKTLACGICGSDLHARKHAHRMVELSRHFPGRKPMDLTRDVVFGHEFCCEILDYGPNTQRTLKAGTISLHLDSGFDCRVRNLSEHGACLEVASQVGIPDDFTLVVEIDHLSKPCHVIWRTATRLGVVFAG